MVKQTPAQWAVSQFGGVRKLGRAIEVNPATVCRWRKRGDGLIPSPFHLPILAAAKRLSLDVKAEDLVYGRRG